MAVPGKKAPRLFSFSQSVASDEDLKIFCQPCDRDGPRLPAFGFCQNCSEHLCQSCYNHHKKATLSRHHVLLDKATMPKTLQSYPEASDFNKPDDLTKPCLCHKKKMIEFYCQDHKLLLCSICVALEHTGKSCHVDYIPDISRQAVDGQEFKEILEQIDAIIQHCQNVKEEYKTVTEQSNDSLTVVLKEIKIYRQEINKRIDELENEVESKVKALQQQNDEELKTTDVICDDITTSATALSDNIKYSNMTKQADKLFIELKTAEVELKEHETCINELTIAKAYNFKSSLKIFSVLQNETCLGTLEQQIISTTAHKSSFRYTHKSQRDTIQTPQGQIVQKLKSLTAQNPSSQTEQQNLEDQSIQQNAGVKAEEKQHFQTLQNILSKASKHVTPQPFVTEKRKAFSSTGEIYVKTSNNEKDCRTAGMTLLNQDHLAVTDHVNKTVKIVDVKNKTVTSEITMSSSPWDITLVNSNQLAATLPHERKIQFLSVNSKNLFSSLLGSSYKLSQTGSLKTEGKCRGISHYQSKLAVTYDYPAKLEILDMQGTVLTTVTTNANGENIFKFPAYVEADSHSIHVSDWGTRQVTMLNWQGHVTGSYEGLGERRGLAVSPDGTVFACDYRKNNIVEISGERSDKIC